MMMMMMMMMMMDCVDCNADDGNVDLDNGHVSDQRTVT